MKSYLEFVYLFQSVNCICSCLVAGYVLNIYINKKKMILSVLMMNVFLVFLYDALTIWMVLLLECISIFYYINKYSLLLCCLSLRYLFMYFMYYLLDGVIYHGIWYMKVTSFQWILFSVVYMLVTYVLLYRFSAFKKLQEYCYVVTIEFGKERLRCYGYWDSGNFANVDHIPIIFLHDARVLAYVNDEYAFIQNQSVQVIKGCIQGVHLPLQDVYIAYLNHDIQNMYPCLLNQLLER